MACILDLLRVYRQPLLHHGLRKKQRSQHVSLNFLGPIDSLHCIMVSSRDHSRYHRALEGLLAAFIAFWSLEKAEITASILELPGANSLSLLHHGLKQTLQHVS